MDTKGGLLNQNTPVVHYHTNSTHKGPSSNTSPFHSNHHEFVGQDMIFLTKMGRSHEETCALDGGDTWIS